MPTIVNARNYEDIIQKRILARLKRMDPRERKIRNVLMRIGNRIVAETKLNITRKRGKKRHPLNPAGGGVKNLVDSGRLRAGVKAQALKKQGNSIEMTVGVFGVVYAAIHEFGGTIRPTGGRKFLSIPLSRHFRGINPRELSDQLLVYHQTKNGDPMLSLRLPSGRLQPAYRLVERANVPARPYFFPAVRKVRPKAIEMIRNIFIEKKK